MYWRGTIKYKFKFIKTPFHSGRLRIYFVPGAANSNASVTTNYNACYSKIVDLRETNEVEIEVPYIFNQAWKQNSQNGLNTSIDPHVGTTIPMGWLNVMVVNTLRNPSTAASAIEVLVETAAGDDFQFAVPQVYRSDWAVPSSDVGIGPITAEERTGYEQSFIPSSKKVGAEVDEVGVGETVISLRQLLKRSDVPFNRPPDLLYGKGVWHLDNPLSKFYLTKVEIATANSKSNFLTLVGQLYRFYSGGMRVTAIPGPTSSTDKPVDTFVFQPRDYNSNELSPVTRPLGILARVLEPIKEFRIPFYSRWNAEPTYVGVPVVGRQAASVQDASKWLITGNRNGSFLAPYIEGLADNYTYFQSAAEDFSYGMLIGPPCTVYFSQTPDPPSN